MTSKCAIQWPNMSHKYVTTVISGNTLDTMIKYISQSDQNLNLQVSQSRSVWDPFTRKKNTYSVSITGSLSCNLSRDIWLAFVNSKKRVMAHCAYTTVFCSPPIYLQHQTKTFFVIMHNVHCNSMMMQVGNSEHIHSLMHFNIMSQFFTMTY